MFHLAFTLCLLLMIYDEVAAGAGHTHAKASMSSFEWKIMLEQTMSQRNVISACKYILYIFLINRTIYIYCIEKLYSFWLKAN